MQLNIRVVSVVLAFFTQFHTCNALSETKSESFSASAYTLSKSTKGVVLISVNWSRKWGCSGFQNAQLKSIAFDKLPVEKTNDDTPADLVLNDAPLIFTRQAFDDYAFIVDPGSYALSSVDIKVAESLTKIGGFKTPRSILIKDGKALGGTFNVEPSEVVYIGHFYLDCVLQQPVIWRYYTEGQDTFNEYLGKIKNKYPSLDTEHVKFKLFETTEFGRPYSLP